MKKTEKQSTTIGIKWMVTTATNVCQRRHQDAICVCCLPLSIDRKTEKDTIKTTRGSSAFIFILVIWC